jgi:hypothetical protein
MSLWYVIVAALLAITVILDIKALRQLYVATELTPAQKTAQTVLILIFPMVGSMLVSHLLSEGAEKKMKSENGHYEDRADVPAGTAHPIRDSLYRHDLDPTHDGSENGGD